MRDQQVASVSKEAAELLLSTGGSDKICETLVSLAFHEPDWRWVQTKCLHFLNSEDASIAAVSATCLGHLARIHRKLDRAEVLSALTAKLDTEEVSGPAADAIDDISRFMPADDRG